MLSQNNVNFFPMPFCDRTLTYTRCALNIICSKFGILGKQFGFENGLILTYVTYKFSVARAECVSENNNIKYLIGFTFQNPWRCMYINHRIECKILKTIYFITDVVALLIYYDCYYSKRMIDITKRTIL